MNHQPSAPSMRTLELLWWVFLGGAILVPALIGFAVPPLADAPPGWAEPLFLAGLAGSLPAWLVKRRFDGRMQQPDFRSLPEPERLRTVQRAIFLGLAAAELPMYAGVAHYLISGQVIGVTILTLISLALMLLYHPSRVFRAR